MAKHTASKSVNIKNKRATFDYELLDTYTAGIVLTGTEIKSIRDSKASLADTYCTFINGELWVKGMHVAQYFYGSYNNHEAKRDRKLLLTKKELRKLTSDSKNPGFTIVPTRLCIGDNGERGQEGDCSRFYEIAIRRALAALSLDFLFWLLRLRLKAANWNHICVSGTRHSFSLGLATAPNPFRGINPAPLCRPSRPGKTKPSHALLVRVSFYLVQLETNCVF